jgi:hypothetical protein
VDWVQNVRITVKERMTIVQDDLVQSYIDTAMSTAAQQTSDLLSQLDMADTIIVEWREANNGFRCYEIELAAARQYSFSRSVIAQYGPTAAPLITLWILGYTGLKAVLEVFNKSQILALGTCPEPSKATWGDIRWGMSGIADGTVDAISIIPMP